MTKEAVFIADDFGLSEEINRAVIHAHRSGALGGACLMMGQPATQAAVALAREHPNLQLGLHKKDHDSV